MTRILRFFLLLLILILILAFFLIPIFISSDIGKNFIVKKVNASIEGAAGLDELAMGWRKGFILTGITYTDGTERTTVKVKKITAKPLYAHLLLGKLSFGQTIVDEPNVAIDFTKSAEPKNRSHEAPENISYSTQAAMPIFALERIDLTINNGAFKVIDPNENIFELSEISSTMNLHSHAKPSKLVLKTVVIDNEKRAAINIEANIQPDKKRALWDLEGAKGTFNIDIKGLRLESLKPVFVLAGKNVEAEGIVWADLKGDIEDKSIKAISGLLRGEKLDIPIPGREPDRFKTDELDVTVKLTILKDMIDVEALQVYTESDWAYLNIIGMVPANLSSAAELMKPDTNYTLKVDFKLDLAKALSQMPRTFGVREGIQVTSGRMSGFVETLDENQKRIINGQANLVGLRGLFESKDISLDQPVNAELEISSDKTSITYDKLNLNASFAKITCTGTDDLLKYKADVNLYDLQNQLGKFIDLGSYSIAGKFAGSGQIKKTAKQYEISSGPPNVINDFILKQEGIPSAAEPHAEIDYLLIAKPDEDVIDIGFLNVDAGLGWIKIKDSVVPLSSEAKKPLKLNLTSNIDLEKAVSLAVVSSSLPKDTKVKGVAKSDVSVAFEEGLYRIIAGTSVQKFRLGLSGRKPFEPNDLSISFDGRVTGNLKDISLENCKILSDSVKLANGTFTRSTKAGQTTLEGKFDCQYDWAAINTLAAPYMLDELMLAGKRKDSINFKSRYPSDKPEQFLANLNTSAALGFDSAEYLGLNFSKTDINLKFENGLLIISPFTTTVNQGKFNFAGNIDFKKKPARLTIPDKIRIAENIAINEQLSSGFMKYLNPLIASSTKVTGKVTFDSESLIIPLSSQHKHEIDIIGRISVDQMLIEGSGLLNQIFSLAVEQVPSQEFTMHPTRFILQNGYLRYDEGEKGMQIDVGDNPINFTGVIGTAYDRRLDMTVLLPYTTEGATIKTGQESDKKRISLKLEGTVEEPKLDIADFGKQLLDEKMKEELDKVLGEEVGDELRKLGIEALEDLFK